MTVEVHGEFASARDLAGGRFRSFDRLAHRPPVRDERADIEDAEPGVDTRVQSEIQRPTCAGEGRYRGNQQGRFARYREDRPVVDLVRMGVNDTSAGALERVCQRGDTTG